MHYRLLLGSTALVGAGMLLASGGTSAQEAGGLQVTLGGYTEFLYEGANKETLQGDSDQGYHINNDTEIHIDAEGTSDSGVTYGSKLEIEADASPDSLITDEANLFFSGAFGRFETGWQDGAVDTMVLDATIISAGTAGVDGDTDNQTTAANIIETGDAAKITYYTPRVAGFQLGASFTPDSGNGTSDLLTSDNSGDLQNAIEAAANWTGDFGAFELGFFGEGTWADTEDGFFNGSDDVKAWAGGGLVGLGGLQFAGSYGHSDFGEGDEIDFVVLGIAYGFGPANVSFNWEHDFVDGAPTPAGGFNSALGDIDDVNIYVVSADVGLLPGVTLKGDVSYNTRDPGAGAVDAGNNGDYGEDTWAGVMAIQLDY